MFERPQGNLNFMVSQAGFILVLSLLCNGARFQMSFKNISQKEGLTKGFASTWRHGSGQSIAAGHGMIKYECVLACPVVFCIRVMFCGCEQTAANKKQNNIALFFVAMCLARACGPLLAACVFSQGSSRSFSQRWCIKKNGQDSQ
jgi:hypothetical protein